jgi:hypothetical protein
LSGRHDWFETSTTNRLNNVTSLDSTHPQFQTQFQTQAGPLRSRGVDKRAKLNGLRASININRLFDCRHVANAARRHDG